MKKYSTYHGEESDGVRDDEVISSYFHDSFVGSMLDVGASHPVENSLSYHFERNGWEVIMVEANPFWIPMLKDQRAGKVLNYAASDENTDEAEFLVAYLRHYVSGAISSLRPDDRLINQYLSRTTGYELIKVPARTIDWILTNEAAGLKSLDVVSLDIEGGELAALRGFDVRRWRPKLFVIENNYEDSDVREFLAGYGYRLDRRVGDNDFFVRDLSSKDS